MEHIYLHRVILIISDVVHSILSDLFGQSIMILPSNNGRRKFVAIRSVSS